MLSYDCFFALPECQKSNRLSPFPVMRKACENGFEGGFLFGVEAASASFKNVEGGEVVVEVEEEEEEMEEQEEEEQEEEQEEEEEDEEEEEEEQEEGELLPFELVSQSGEWKEGFLFVKEGEELEEAVRRHCAKDSLGMERADCEKLLAWSQKMEEEEEEVF